MKTIIRELVFSFVGGVMGASIWFYTQALIVPNLHEMNITLPLLIAYYAIPIQSIGTAIFFAELWVFRSLRIKNR